MHYFIAGVVTGLFLAFVIAWLGVQKDRRQIEKLFATVRRSDDRWHNHGSD